LEPLVQRLNERGSGAKFDRKGLAQLLSGLQQFMEDALGVNVSGRGGERGAGQERAVRREVGWQAGARFESCSRC